MDLKQFIETHIPQMDSPEKVYQLFHGLGYKTLDTSYKGKEAWGLKEKDKESVKEIYAIANYDKRFQILLVELKSSISDLQSSILKTLPLDLEKEIFYPFFVFTHDYQNYSFILVEKTREDVGVWKRKLVKLNLDRENAYYTDKWVISKMSIEKEQSEPLQIYKTLKESLSVEKVSKIFFEDYKMIFLDIRKFLLNQEINMKQAHEFSLQLLNRIMFIYFIDKKGWLRNSPKFMKWFWNRYVEEKKKNNAEDHFYERWLKILFFEAFNNRFSHPRYLPQDVRDTLSLAPYLNGGLFKRNELDGLSVNLYDEFIERILKFFEKYNFTIREDLPLDVEVAVDPQMIGYVYESLANIAEKIYERQDLGIFYTPRIEVDFMCRRSLLEYLSKTTDISKDILYKLLFDEDKTKIEKTLKINDYEKLEESLDGLSALDPACGSGAFLVGMLNVLVEIYKLIFRHLNREMTDYQLKKRIIGNSLYGVDIMPWAVHSAELRLWLSLMIESDLSLGELKLYPLLPNLDFKLRIGDSLVQEVGGVNLNLRDAMISPPLKRKLSELKREKEKYYDIAPTAKFKTDSALLQEELRIFDEILNERIINLAKKKQSFTRTEEQLEMYKGEISQKELKEKIEKEKRKIDEEIDKLVEVKRKLKEQKPLVWDIDFAEIFGEKGGFDIVIGNPPYVRQEKIAPPNRLRSEITNEGKKEYKEKLLKSVQIHFPFIKAIDKKSDYYVYFYFHGLALLNEKGTFCFITSNSWLDVGYGKNLQEFLLEYVPIIAIYDNQARRSFEHADVNTIIALFSSPYKTMKALPALQNTAKFIMFKRPFEEVINTENLLKIDNADSVINTDDFRVYPKKHDMLLEEGWEYPEDTVEEQKKTFEFSIGKYTGNKWGGKYLRAPDIFFTILEKGTRFIEKMSNYFEGERYLNTGGADGFFIITDTTPQENGLTKIRNDATINKKVDEFSGTIEEKYLVPIIKDYTKKDKKIEIDGFDAYCLVVNDKPATIKGTYVYEYIKWGEKQGYHQRSVTKSQKSWYKPTRQMLHSSQILVPRSFYDRHVIHYNPNNYLSLRFYRLHLKKGTAPLLIAFLNTTYISLFMETLGNKSLGQGVLDFFMADFLNLQIPIILNEAMLKPFKDFKKRNSKSIFDELNINPKQPIRSQKPNPLPDRKALDDIVFDILGLTEDERNEVYWAVCELVKNRLEKARSA